MSFCINFNNFCTNFYKVFSVNGAIIVAGAMSVSVPFSTNASETFTYATNTAPTGMRGEAEKGFIEALHEVSEGEINIIPYWGSSVMEGDEVLNGVNNNIVDMGFININYFPNRLRLNNAFQLFPEGPDNYSDIMSLYHSAYEEIEELGREIEGHNQKVVYIYPYQPYAGVFTNEVTSIEDFQGKRVRAASRWILNLLGDLGATPVSVPWGDTYQSLQSGAIDGVFTNYDSLNRTGMDEIAQNIFVAQRLWFASPMLITINQQKWDAMSEEMREWFVEAFEVAQDNFGTTFEGEFNRILENQKEAGYKITQASDNDINHFMALPAVEENRKVWLEEAAEAGVDGAERIVDELEYIINQYTATNN